MSANRALPTARHAARARAFELVHDLQTSSPTASEELAKLTAEAEENGWDEVVRAGIFGSVIDAWCSGAPSEVIAATIGDLVARSTEDGDPVMLALGLALRSDSRFGGPNPTAAIARDADLARAVVLLEQSGGGVLERISAHTACGIALCDRWLFELGDEQYLAALALGEEEPAGTLDFILSPVVFDLAETQVSWASILRQLGDQEGVQERLRSWQVAASTATTSFTMFEGWQVELRALGLLLAAIAGDDTAEESLDLLASLPGGEVSLRTAGLLQLAAALSDAGAGRARAGAEAALATLEPSLFPQVYDLALYLNAQLEADQGHGAGLSYGRRQLEQHWAERLAALGAMQSRIHVERLQREREVLTRHARTDDLTGIGNRRALEQYLVELEQLEVRTIALMLLDVDAFKNVNDHHGHLAGDAVLIAIARVLEHNIAPHDLAVRLGGDEFAVVLADADVETAFERATSFLAQFDEVSFQEVSTGLEVGLSAGVASGPPSLLTQLLAEADAALYRAKAGGGRRVLRSRLAAGVA